MAEPTSGAEREIARRCGAFAGAWSLEATRPQPAELDALREIVAPGTAIYLSAVPNHSRVELVDAARGVAAAGFEPVPHVAARGFTDIGQLDDFLHDLKAAARVRRMLLIGGDLDQAGPFGQALDVIASGLLQRHGIEEIGLAGYPDGHPRIGDEELDRALRAKIEAAQAAGLAVHIATQFCFDPAVIVGWLIRLRRNGIMVPVQVGLIGPTNLPTLLRFAQRCGVRASARGLMRTGIAKALFGVARPDSILAALLQAGPEIGDIAPHFFSFGGVVRTATYAAEAAAQQFNVSNRDATPPSAAIPH
jgi:methylenetetrahydrofolate reductase (NADPH)